MVYRIKLLRAHNGDSIWVEYGKSENIHRILIDGGVTGTYEEIKKELQQLPEDKRHFDLLVITHIDNDHIVGILDMLSDTGNKVTFDDIWFNSWEHLPKKERYEAFGIDEGERLSELLVKRKLPWNMRFGGKRVCIPKSGKIPERTLLGGMKIQILSPYLSNLESLAEIWKKECKKTVLDEDSEIHELDEPQLPAGYEAFGAPDIDKLVKSKFNRDSSKANGSSIAFTAEYESKVALFSGDAFASVLKKSIKKIVGARHKLSLNAFKLPHHGSKANTHRSLLKSVDCTQYLFSTNGATHDHPHDETLARVIKHGGSCPTLVFNYNTAENPFLEKWDNRILDGEYDYKVDYPVNNDAKVIDL